MLKKYTMSQNGQKNSILFKIVLLLTDPSVAPKDNENLMFLIPLAPGLKGSTRMREKVF